MNGKSASLADFTFDVNLSAVRFDGLFDQTQSQTVPVNLRVNDGFRAVEGFENLTDFPFLDADSFIFDRYLYCSVTVSHGNFQPLVAVAVFHGVDDQI